MLVEESVFNKSISINCIHSSGQILVINVDPKLKIDDLKRQVVAHFFETETSEVREKTTVYHTLFLTKNNSTLRDNLTIKECEILSGDEVLLLKKRVDKKHHQEKEIQSPMKEEIALATENLAAFHTEHSGDSVEPIELSKHKGLLVALFLLADKLLCMNAKIKELYEKTEKCLAEEKACSKEPSQPTYGRTAMAKLLDMGFSKKRTTEALIHTNNNFPKATQWLMEKDSHQETNLDKDTTNTTKEKPSGTHQKTIAEVRGIEKIILIISAFRAYGRKGFVPDPHACQRLQEMGFCEEDVIEGLRLNNNNEQQACEWLLNQGDKATQLSLLEVSEEQFGENSVLYNKLRESPEVQIALNDPKALIALMSILENTNTVQHWASDDDIGRLLNSVSKIYKNHLRETRQEST